MKELEKEIQLYQNKALELAEAKEDAFNETSEISILAIGMLLKKIDSSFDELLEVNATKTYYDKDLKDTIKETIGLVIDAFSKIQPPTINVSPQLKFDLSLLQPVLNKLGEQNNTLINLVGKFNNNQNENLLKLITSVVEKQISFLEKEVKQMDYTKNFTAIEAAINKRPTEFKSKVTNYNNQGRIDEITTKVIK